MQRRPWIVPFWIVVLLAGPCAAAPWFSPAPDVVVYCTPALEAPLRAVAARWTALHGVAVHLFAGSPDGLTGLIQHRARADIVVADAPAVQAMAGRKLVRAGTVVALGFDPYVLVRPADAQPAAMLVATRPVVLTDATTAASFDGAAVLQAALPGSHPARVIGVADTPSVIATLRGDGDVLGVVQQTEARAPGIGLVATLAGPPAPMAAALVTQGQSRDAAGLLDFIAGPDGRAMLDAAGMEPRA
jgi:ABC-type molybdate transport system substrate-binding protein